MKTSKDSLRPLASRKADEFFSDRASRADIEAARRLLRRDGGQPPEPADTLPSGISRQPAAEEPSRHTQGVPSASIANRSSSRS